MKPRIANWSRGRPTAAGTAVGQRLPTCTTVPVVGARPLAGRPSSLDSTKVGDLVARLYSTGVTSANAANTWPSRRSPDGDGPELALGASHGGLHLGRGRRRRWRRGAAAAERLDLAAAVVKALRAAGEERRLRARFAKAWAGHGPPSGGSGDDDDLAAEPRLTAPPASLPAAGHGILKRHDHQGRVGRALRGQHAPVDHEQVPTPRARWEESTTLAWRKKPSGAADEVGERSMVSTSSGAGALQIRCIVLVA